MKRQVGLIGLGVMGQNLALNIHENAYSIAIYNRTASKTENFIHNNVGIKSIKPTYTLKDLVSSVERPRKIILVVKSGQAVDDLIDQLKALLVSGDLIIDSGNSFFKDTIRRSQELIKNGIFYIGAGISGGEKGAREGPAIMVGGQKRAYQLVQELFKKIAAKAKDGIPCISYNGPHGAGHYVKMIHNGIEYGDMQLIGECVWVLKKVLKMQSDKIAEILAQWNQKEDVLHSYLVEITAEMMKKRDNTKSAFLIDMVADITAMKGTGTWTVQSALELMVPIPTITAAVYSREMSQKKAFRAKLFKQKQTHAFPPPPVINSDELINLAHDALYLAKISSYAQGMALLQSASAAYQFDFNLKNIVQGWRAGCIIRARLLEEMTRIYQINPLLSNLLLAPYFLEKINTKLPKMSRFLNIAQQSGIPIPAMNASFSYILQLRSPIMISAQVSALQRDFFGAHGYFRLKESNHPDIIIDQNGRGKVFHTQWMKDGRPEVEKK